MEESKRQKQIAQLIQEEMTVIFRKEGINIIDGGMVSISKILVTPDLLEARIHLSFFKIKEPKVIMAEIKEKMGEIRGQLGNKLRHQLRRIPELQFFEDDTLDHVSRIEDLLNKIKNEEQ
jgi:ribosome-binding factor A